MSRGSFEEVLSTLNSIIIGAFSILGLVVVVGGGVKMFFKMYKMPKAVRDALNNDELSLFEKTDKIVSAIF